MAAVDQASSVMLKDSKTHKTNTFTHLHQGATPVTDHPLKNDIADLEELAKYVMMPKGVALAAFSRPTVKESSESVSSQSNSTCDDDGLDLDGLDLELPSIKEFRETVPFPKSPRELRRTWEAAGIPMPREEISSPVQQPRVPPSANSYTRVDYGRMRNAQNEKTYEKYSNSFTKKRGNDDDDRSLYQTVVSPNLKDVRFMKDPNHPGSGGSSGKRRVPLPPEFRKWIGSDSETNTETTITEQMHTAQDYLSDTDTELDDLDSPDEIEDSILEKLDENPDTSTSITPISVLTASEERNEARNWRTVVIGGEEKRVDMKVIEPYKRVLSHGGYLSAGSHNAIIIFSACFLPDNSRIDYAYVMDNLFLYVMMTLEQLITEDYVLVFLQGATPWSVVPSFSWLKRCYQLIDRRLRKNLQRLYVVHPNSWLRLLVAFIKPFISSKFSKKLHFIYSLAELSSILPLEQASIPDRVKQYDALKQSMMHGRNRGRTKV